MENAVMTKTKDISSGERFRVLSRLAAEGDVTAMNGLADCYHEGAGTKRNYEEAVYWYIKAAHEGDAYAAGHLGACYLLGQGVKKNTDAAIKWLKLGSEGGSDEATNNLGVCYLNGEGVEQDKKKGVELIRQAAYHRFPLGQLNLGTCYENGEGVNPSDGDAAKWYLRAMSEGEPDAERKLDALIKKVKRTAKKPVTL